MCLKRHTCCNDGLRCRQRGLQAYEVHEALHNFSHPAMCGTAVSTAHAFKVYILCGLQQGACGPHLIIQVTTGIPRRWKVMLALAAVVYTAHGMVTRSTLHEGSPGRHGGGHLVAVSQPSRALHST